jgi:hypothetical protein
VDVQDAEISRGRFICHYCFGPGYEEATWKFKAYDQIATASDKVHIDGESKGDTGVPVEKFHMFA